MQICVDATSLLLRSAGVKNYTWHWMESLKREAPQHSVTAFPIFGELGELHHDRSMQSLWRTVPGIALLHLCNIRGSRVIDLVAGRADVFHASSLLRNLPRRPKLTGTLYDMTAMLMPEVHTAGNIRAEKSYFDRVLTKADGLIAISQSTKDDAVRFGIDADRIAVIYPGIDERFFSAQPTVRSKPYVLFLGTLEPRKNVETLLDAWLRLPPDLRESHDLLLAGPTGWASEQRSAVSKPVSPESVAQATSPKPTSPHSPPEQQPSSIPPCTKDSASLSPRRWQPESPASPRTSPHCPK